jgi:transketolase
VKFNPNQLRKTVLEMAYHGQSVHVGCAFSVIEIFSALYGNVLNFNPDDPNDPSRDYLVLSKGHGVLAQYACFRELKWITDSEVEGYFSNGSRLHGLSEGHIPGCEVTSGSLGHGLPIAVGIAKGLKLQGKSQRVYCVIGDGEINEGPIWEGLLFAAHHKLDNLHVIVDANEFQAMGKTSEILNIEPLEEKFKAFGFEATTCNGHSVEEVTHHLVSFKRPHTPKALVARTIKGKGISFMERENKWHYTRLDLGTLELSLRELDSKGDLS